MDFTPQVETREISDADLDNVSGGLVGGAVNSVLGTVDSVSPVSVTGTLNQVTGTVSDVTGVDVNKVTGAL